MTRKKYAYKHLTNEMMKELDNKIKELGRGKLYDKVKHNIMEESVAQLQNMPDAFKEIYRGHWHATKWENDFFTKPIVVDMHNLTMEQEMLHYIDDKRFLL